MEITVTVDENLMPTLQRLADAREITPEFYLSDHIASLLLSQYKTRVVEMITTKKLPDIVTMETAVKAVDDDIKERDKVTFVPAPPDAS